MVIRRQNDARLSSSVRIDPYNYGSVDQLKYMQTILTGNNKTTKEIEARIRAENIINAFSD